MKVFLAVSILICIALCFCACDSAKKEDVSYVFRYNGVNVGCNADMAEILAAIGDPISYSESASCAADGLDKKYSYSGFSITTVPDRDIDRICRIELKNDLVKTPEGAHVGMDRRRIIEIYGDGFGGRGSGIEYVCKNCRLIFSFRDDKVTGIIYEAI